MPLLHEHIINPYYMERYHHKVEVMLIEQSECLFMAVLGVCQRSCRLDGSCCVSFFMMCWV